MEVILHGAGLTHNIVTSHCRRWLHNDLTSNPFQYGLARAKSVSSGQQSRHLLPNPYSSGFFVADGLLLIRFTPSKTEPSIRRKVNTEILSRPLRAGSWFQDKQRYRTQGTFPAYQDDDRLLIKARYRSKQVCISGVLKSPLNDYFCLEKSE